MDITNKTAKPLSIPLPGGKKLFLGPGKSGQISPKAREHPPVAKLLESGDITTTDGDTKPKGDLGNSGPTPSAQRHGASGAIRQSGDR